MDVNRGSYANLMIKLIIWFYEKLESLFFFDDSIHTILEIWQNILKYVSIFLGLALFREATWAPQLQVAENVQPVSEMEIICFAVSYHLLLLYEPF